MSHPRRIIAGTTYLITRRCIGRQFLLRPDAAMNALFRYCLAEAASREGILLHAYVAMSNHLHLVVTDPRGLLPRFMERLVRHLALGVQALRRGHQGPVFEPGRSYNAVALETEEAVWDKLVYTRCNPVKAGLVRHAYQWPGASSLPDELTGAPQTLQRPACFGRDLPEATSLALQLPPALEPHGAEAVAAALQLQVRQREQELCRGHRSRFLGVDRVTQTSWRQRPKASGRHRVALEPGFAAVTREAWLKAAQQLRGFRRAYRQAWQQLKDCLRALFPAGTWWLVKYRFVDAAVAVDGGD